MIQFTADIKYNDFRMEIEFEINDDDETKRSEFEREMYELERKLSSLGIISSDYADVSLYAEDLEAKFRMAVKREDAAKFASDFENLYTEANSGFEAALTDGKQYIRFTKYDLTYYTLQLKFCRDGITLEMEKELPHYCLTEMFNDCYRLKL